MNKFIRTLNTTINKSNITVAIFVIVLGSLLSAFIPPFQSPDEAIHIMRAYLLTKGQILLTSTHGRAAGGEIDRGLFYYIRDVEDIHSHPDNALSPEEKSAVYEAHWTGKPTYAGIPGAGYYFPLAYSPQALGLAIGENIGLSIQQSYQLARFFSLIFSVLVIAAAFAMFPPNVFTVALLIIPMTVFQFCSASLDAFTIALTILCVSIFMRGCNNKYSFPGWMYYVLAGSIFTVVTSRTHLFPLLALPLFLWIARKNRIALWQFLIITILSIGWLVIAIKATYVSGATSDYSTSKIISYYINHPIIFYEVLIATITDSQLLEYYKNSFLGILVDTTFEYNFYNLALICLIGTAVFSFSLKDIKDNWRFRVILAGLAFCSVFLIFLALLVTFNPVPTTKIGGVQGRYFLGPLILLGYALSGSGGLLEGRWKKIGIIPFALLATLVVVNLPKIIINRYYLPQYSMLPEYFTLHPSTILSKDFPIKILMTNDHEHNQEGLKGLGVLMATYARQNLGEAVLHLKGPDGTEFTTERFSLTNLTDNSYYFFKIDSKCYSSGEIVIGSADAGTDAGAGGISVWESHTKNGPANTCLIYEYNDGKKNVTPGCPPQ